MLYIVFRNKAKNEYWRKVLFVSGNKHGNPSKKQLFKFRYLDLDGNYLVLPQKNGSGFVVTKIGKKEKTVRSVVAYIFLLSGIIGADEPVAFLGPALPIVMIVSVLFRFIVFLVPRRWRLIQSWNAGQSGDGSPIDD